MRSNVEKNINQIKFMRIDIEIIYMYNYFSQPRIIADGGGRCGPGGPRNFRHCGTGRVIGQGFNSHALRQKN
jgi:hypothetical protein